MNFRKKHEVEKPSFQIAPMIDVIFLLLCFFISSQIFSQWETEIDVKLPTARTAKIPSRLPGEIIINVMKDGRMIVNSQLLDENGLKQLLNRIVVLFPGQAVLVRADRETFYDHIIKVIDLCRSADIWNISFATGVPDDEDSQ